MLYVARGTEGRPLSAQRWGAPAVQGDVFADFDLQMRQSAANTSTSKNNGRFRIDVNRSITGTINGGGPDIELRTLNGSVILRKGT